MTENTENFNLDQIIKMVSETPNNSELGALMRQYVIKNSKLKPKAYSDKRKNRISGAQVFGDFGGYIDVEPDEEDNSIDLGDKSDNLSIG